MEQKKILVIEDSHELAASLEDILSLASFDTTICLSGKEGLEAAFSLHPDLIILDIRLPDMSGYEVFHIIRNDAWGATAKIIILTASEGRDNIAKNIDLPDEDILFKPQISVAELLEKIKATVAS